jgi:hypothetical protein
MKTFKQFLELEEDGMGVGGGVPANNIAPQPLPNMIPS